MIAGVVGQMDAEDFGVYWMVCTLIYSRGGPIDDDHVWISGLFRGTHWRSIRASLDRLIDAGKVSQEGGKLMVTRCAEELQRAGNRISKATQNGRMGGRPSNKNNNMDEPDGYQNEKLTINYQPSTTKDSVPSGTGADAPDSKTRIFGRAREWIVGHSGKTDKQVRTLLGQWCRDHGDDATLDAINEARRQSPVDPIPYVIKVLSERETAAARSRQIDQIISEGLRQ